MLLYARIRSLCVRYFPLHCLLTVASYIFIRFFRRIQFSFVKLSYFFLPLVFKLAFVRCRTRKQATLKNHIYNINTYMKLYKVFTRYLYTYIHMKNTRVHAYIFVRAHICICVCACRCAQVFLYIYYIVRIHTRARAHIYTYTRTCNTYMKIYVTYIQQYQKQMQEQSIS